MYLNQIFTTTSYDVRKSKDTNKKYVFIRRLWNLQTFIGIENENMKLKMKSGPDIGFDWQHALILSVQD